VNVAGLLCIGSYDEILNRERQIVGRVAGGNTDDTNSVTATRGSKRKSKQTEAAKKVVKVTVFVIDIIYCRIGREDSL